MKRKTVKSLELGNRKVNRKWKRSRRDIRRPSRVWY